MSYQYGIGICREALTYLSGDGDIQSRLVKAFGELSVIKEGEDLSHELYNELNSLDNEFRLRKGNDDISLHRDFTHRVVFLCVEIIIDNSQAKLIEA